MKHRIITSLAAATLLLTTAALASCGKQTLAVKSVDYPQITELTASEPDYDRIWNWYFTDNPYCYNDCFLKLNDNNELVIYSDEPRHQTHLFCGDSGYFVGLSIGDYDGWVILYPYDYGYISSEKYSGPLKITPDMEPFIVAHENCLGFIKIDNKNGYMITSDYWGFEDENGNDIYSRIYRLYIDENSNWQWELIGSTKENISAYFYDKESNGIYISGLNEITYFNLATYEFTTITQTPHFHRSPASMVKLENKLYICWNMGIYEYDLETDEGLWYLIPHEKYGTKEEKAKYKEYCETVELKKRYGFVYLCEHEIHDSE